MSVEGGLSLGGGVGKEILKEAVNLFTLPSGGLQEAAQDAVVFQALVGAGALNHSAHDHHGAQTALGQVIGGRNLWVAETGEEEFLFLARKPLAKALGSGIAQRRCTKPAQSGPQGGALFPGGFGTPGALAQTAVGLAGVVDKTLDRLTELAGLGIGRLALKQGQFLVEFFGLGFDGARQDWRALGWTPL